MINDLGDWVIPHLAELYQRALENVYWRSRRPGLAPDKAESLKDVVAKALYESSQPQEPQRNQRANEQPLRAGRPRLVKVKDIAGNRPEVPSSGTRIGNKNIMLGGVDEPEEPLTPETSGADGGQHSGRAREWGTDVGADDDETGATTSTYSIRPTHLSEAETKQLMSRPDVKLTDTKGAGATRIPRHHLFPQPYREWFRDHKIDIDRYTIEMTWGWHSAIHTMGWNRKVREFKDLEALRGKPYTRMHIFRFINELRRDFNLKGRKILPYED
jgi:hypothetical protein